MITIHDYFEALETVTKWCVQRAKVGDVTVEQLADKFAKNVVEQANSKSDKETLQ